MESGEEQNIRKELRVIAGLGRRCESVKVKIVWSDHR